ncbi:vanillate/3-O-methylgallate O-demethylase [Candidatus Rariloculus sp.]|uniref:vanillate/3-O-methylgallate O-demethylase n=1 Tax=Candidatus Rariloculus sp. TaxID=3101265 RepID=UPI003D0C4F97
MSRQSLEDLLQTVDSPVELLRNSQIGPYAFPVVPPEFTNWRDEQRAWQETSALFDQSHHMTDMYIEGPDALKLLSDLGINTVRNFAVDKAKQFVACNYDGHVIGDAILFYLAENSFNLVGRPPAHNWVQYHCETGGYDASIERDERSAARQGPPVRKAYRYQIQGPRAQDIMEKLTGAPAPDIRFFNMNTVSIAGRAVRALRHGMVGQPGWELFGPWDDGAAVKSAIVEAGQEFGIRQVGAKAYSTSALESGWIPSPLPAIYTGEAVKAYRQWLPAQSYEGTASLGGSFQSGDISDYYLTPYDLGYGPMVRFDHDFIGREALENIAANARRKKVSLAWHAEDVTRAFGSLFRDSDCAKFIDLPLSNYATLPYDKVLRDGAAMGLSTYTGYTHNGRTMLSLAIVEVEHSEPGTEVTVVWGEAGGGSSKPTVERHSQTEIRAIVSPVPYSRVAREEYAEGWRTERQ